MTSKSRIIDILHPEIDILKCHGKGRLKGDRNQMQTSKHSDLSAVTFTETSEDFNGRQGEFCSSLHGDDTLVLSQEKSLYTKINLTDAILYLCSDEPTPIHWIVRVKLISF